jgi:chromosome segregation ATPase
MKPGLLFVLFLLFATTVVVAAWNGKFSPRQRVTPPKETPEYLELKASYEVAKKIVDELKDDVFRHENVTTKLEGVRTDTNSKVRELLETIGRMSETINDLTRENDQLRKLLSDLTTDFEELRNKLRMCEARDVSRRLTHQFCQMDPASNLLL